MNAQYGAVTLFCLPCAGASATMYGRWQNQAPAWLRIVPVELPGRGSRFGEPFVEDFTQLADQLHAEIQPRIAGPFALFGHSMGAMLAHAVARRLRTGVNVPRQLFVSASPAPSRRHLYPPPAREDAALVADLRKQGGTPDEVFASPELLRLTLDTLRADYRVCASFRHEARTPLAVPLCAFGGRSDGIADADIAAWREETNGDFRPRWFDGGHFFIRSQESLVIQAVTNQLRRTYDAGGIHAGLASA